jgi:hypothetical protein
MDVSVSFSTDNQPDIFVKYENRTAGTLAFCHFTNGKICSNLYVCDYGHVSALFIKGKWVAEISRHVYMTPERAAALRKLGYRVGPPNPYDWVLVTRKR